MADQSKNSVEALCQQFETKVCIKDDVDLGNKYEPQTTEPIAAPLKTLDDVLMWKPGEDEFNVAMEPLAARTAAGNNQPMTLICHDMMGGYIDDRFVQGVPRTDSYRFYHWQYLDTFIYFSHYFVTLPPPCWTNAAHKNGVLMLGTVITEWKDGASRCEQVFQCESAYKIFADKLVAMCKYYQFDGWLINIENPIKPEHMPQLVDFVSYLTKEMRAQAPWSKVIWYDSVIEDGSLRWQDMLNRRNCMFFNGSDGIFLNYTWNENKLADSVRNAGNRIQDVYVGVDVFGRNCFGGGGWNTYKAMKVVRSNNLSAAIFAPGWVYEKLGTNDFIQNQNKFWEDQLHEYLFTHGVTSLPFVSNFCRGYGMFGFKFGQKAMEKAWCNLSAQQIQPSYNKMQFSGDQPSMSYDTSDGYSGGGSFLLKGTFGENKQQSFKLFDTDMEAKTPFLVSVTMKKDAGCEGYLYFGTTDGQKVFLVASADPKPSATKIMSDYGINFSLQVENSALPSTLQDSISVAYEPVCDSCDKIVQDITCGQDTSKMDFGGWETRNYLLPQTFLNEGSKISLIGLLCIPMTDAPADGSYSLRLGELKIIDPSSFRDHNLQVTDITCQDITWVKPKQEEGRPNDLLNFSITLKWKYSTPALHFDIFCSGVTRDPNMSRTIQPSEKVFVGRAHTKLFRVCQMVVPKPSGDHKNQLTWFIQPTTKAGLCAPLENASCFVLSYSG